MANELLPLVASELPLKDLGSFLLVNRRLAFLLTPSLLGLAVRPVGWLDALHWVAVRGHIPLIDIVLRSEVDINLRGTTGFTALEYAASEESVETVAFLLEKGANLHLEDRNGDTPFTKAMKYLPPENQRGLSMPAEYLLANGRSLTRGWNPIEKRERIAIMLMEHGADITHRSSYLWSHGWSALHWAAIARSVMVKLLLGRGFDVNSKTNNRQTPFLSVPFEARERTEEVVKVLLENGANAAALTQRQNTALHYAALGGKTKIVELLLEHWAGLDAQNVDGCSTLHKVLNSMCDRAGDPFGRLTVTDKTLVGPTGYAQLDGLAIAAKVDMIKLLLERGANINIKNSGGRSVLDLAK